MKYRFALRNSLVVLGFLFFFLPAHTQTDAWPLGQKIDTVRCLQDSTHSYALYLPTYYSPDQIWPVVYIFEPAARGALPVDSFRQGAERYGYILAASNVSRNGPMENNFAAADILLNDVRTRFAIDHKRQYYSGFSGGARAATAQAQRQPNSAGVIACGAGFPAHVEYHPSAESNFVYLALVGIRDLNYREVHALRPRLQDWKIPHRIKAFDAGHQWPPDTLLTEALAWLDLQAMKQGDKEIDQTFIHTQAQKRQATIDRALQAENWLAAANAYRQYLADFQDLVVLQETEAAFRQLEQDKEYRKASKQAKLWQGKEAKRKAALKAAAEPLYYPTFTTDSLRRWWQKEIQTLQKMERSKNIAKSEMAARLLNWITVISVEWGRGQMRGEAFESAREYFRLGVKVNPNNFYFHYLLAQAQSALKDRSAALTTLRQAVALGLPDRKWLDHPAFDPLRTQNEFVELRKSLP